MKRVFLFLVAAALCVVGYVFLVSLMRGSPYDLGSAAAAFMVALALLALNYSFFRSEGKSLAAIGFDVPSRRLGEFGFAFLAGCAVVAVWTLILSVIMSPRWHAYDGFDPGGAVSRIAFCLFNNTGEELAYRGYLLWKIARRFGPTVAVVSTSALFAVLHVQAGVPWSSAVTVIFTSGVLYAVLLLRWKSLPLVVGFHVANNVVQELIGLRVTPLTVLRPTFAENITTVQQLTALALTAVFNLSIVWFVARNKQAETYVP